MGFASENFICQICFEAIKTNRHFEMRLKFFYVVMVVSIFRYNKLFWHLREVCHVRFDGGCCGGTDLQTDQKGVRLFCSWADAEFEVYHFHQWIVMSQDNGTKNYFERNALLPHPQNAYRTFLQFISFSAKKAFTMRGISFFFCQLTNNLNRK